MIELEKVSTQLEELKLFTTANLLERRLQIATNWGNYKEGVLGQK